MHAYKKRASILKLFRLLKKTHRHIEKYKVASLEIENIDYVI